MQDRFELKENGHYISLDHLYELAKEEILSELDSMSTKDALYLGNEVRREEDLEILYENKESEINDQLSGWEPWDLLQMEFDYYADYFKMECGEPEFTNDVWVDLDTTEIAYRILDGKWRSYIPYEIKDILTDYAEAKAVLSNISPTKREGTDLLARFTNCEADVTDLLQFIDRIAKADE